MPALGRRASGNYDAKKADSSRRRRRGTNLDDIINLDKCAKRVTCLDDMTIMMAVKVQVEKIKIVCIHP